MTTQCSDRMIQQHDCAQLMFCVISQSQKLSFWYEMQLSNRSLIYHPSIQTLLSETAATAETGIGTRSVRILSSKR